MTMKNYQDYSAHDFLKDEFFVKWVLDPHPDTDHFWQKWIKSHPDKVETINKARMFIERVNYHDEFRMDDASYTRIFENLMRFKKEQDLAQSESRNSGSYRSWQFAAAAVFLLLLSALVYIVVFDFGHLKKGVESGVDPEQLIVEEAPFGSKLSLVLPDGTKLKLNGGSRISYLIHFDSRTREVLLEGEAFFEVVRDETRPFIITSHDLRTEVLGTSFNIRSHEDEIRVAVVEGLVKVSTVVGKSSLIRPDSMAIYQQKDQNLRVERFNKMEEIGWKDDILFFNKMPLNKVFEELESWYGITIEVKGDLPLSEAYSGRYYSENLENVLSGIGYTSGFNFSIQGKRVTVFKSTPPAYE